MAIQTQRGLQTYTVQEAQNAALGQLGSFLLASANSESVINTGGAERCIVAITMLTDCQFSTLTSIKDKYDGGSNWLGTTENGYGDYGDSLNSSMEFPRGITIYGRWSVITLQSANMRCICYLG